MVYNSNYYGSIPSKNVIYWIVVGFSFRPQDIKFGKRFL